MIFVMAMEQRGVLGDGFQSVAFPAAKDRAKFLFFFNKQKQLLDLFSVEEFLWANDKSNEPAVDCYWEVEC